MNKGGGPAFAVPVIAVHGHVYVGKFVNAPCPVRGWDAFLVATERKGVPAYWLNGILYLLKRGASWRDYPQIRMVA